MDELEKGVRAALSPIMDQVVFIQHPDVGSGGFIVYVGDNDVLSLQKEIGRLIAEARLPERVEMKVLSGSGPTV